MLYKKECLSDDWTVFGKWLETFNRDRITPSFKEYLLGLTLQRLYLSGIKDIRKKNEELLKKRVLKNRELIWKMVYWLKVLRDRGIPPKKVREVTISFWIKTNYCLSHWWIAYRHISQKWDYYKNLIPEVPEEFRKRVEKAIQVLERRGYF